MAKGLRALHCWHGRHHPGPPRDHRRGRHALRRPVRAATRDPHLGLLRRVRLRRRHSSPASPTSASSAPCSAGCWAWSSPWSSRSSPTSTTTSPSSSPWARSASRSARASSSPSGSTGTGWPCWWAWSSAWSSACVSVFANMPMIVLVVVGSIAGAVGVVGGLMLLVGSLNSADFSRGDFTDTVSNSFGLVPAPAGARRRRHRHPGHAAGPHAPDHPGSLVRRGLTGLRRGIRTAT